MRDAGHTVTLFEECVSCGGRVFTYTRGHFTVDPGAQYIKGGSPLTDSWLTERFASPELLYIVKPVWTFDAAGMIREGDPVQNADARWTYRDGLHTLPRLLARDLDVRLFTRVTRLRFAAPGWQLFNEVGQLLAEVERLLVTLPAPQTLALLDDSELPEAIRGVVHEQLKPITYNPLLSIALGYQPAPRARPYYALVNTDKAHPLSWLAWEHEKSPARIPPGCGLLIAQLAPQYSREHFETPAEALFPQVYRLITDLIGEELPAPMFRHLKRWRYALPTRHADAETLNNLTLPFGLALCGDAFTDGRVHLALESGCAVAQKLSAARS